MSTMGYWVIGFALFMYAAKWAYGWKLERAYMRTQREKNAKESISSLVYQWKGEDRAALLAASIKEQKQHYAKMEGFNNVGERQSLKERLVYLDRTVDRLIAKKRQEYAKGSGVGYDLGKIARETGLTANELEQAFKRIGDIMRTDGPRRGAEMPRDTGQMSAEERNAILNDTKKT
jgi:hypothetical protein